MCQRRFGASERRACKVVGQVRSTQRRPTPVRPPAEQRLRARLRDISRSHPRWGYRRVRIELTKEGCSVNTKRVHRLWRDEELQVRPHRRKRRRGASTIDEVLASRPNEVWALDFQFDATADGRQLKLLHGVDEFTREAIVMRVGRSCDADEVVTQVEDVMATRGAPDYLRCDNGPEFIARALADWCRFSGAGTVFIEPGSPWQNPYVESFNARVRDELLNMTEFYTLHEAEVLVDDFQMDYNWLRPHSSLGDLAPAVFAERWRMDHQPARLS